MKIEDLITALMITGILPFIAAIITLLPLAWLLNL